MSDPLREALERMIATVAQFLSEVPGAAGSSVELEECISDFATVIAGDSEAARAALAIEPEYEYRVIGEWQDTPTHSYFKGTYYSAVTIETAEGRILEVRKEFPDADVYVERRIKAGEWKRVS